MPNRHDSLPESNACPSARPTRKNVRTRIIQNTLLGNGSKRPYPLVVFTIYTTYETRRFAATGRWCVTVIGHYFVLGLCRRIFQTGAKKIVHTAPRDTLCAMRKVLDDVRTIQNRKACIVLHITFAMCTCYVNYTEAYMISRFESFQNRVFII